MAMFGREKNRSFVTQTSVKKGNIDFCEGFTINVSPFRYLSVKLDSKCLVIGFIAKYRNFYDSNSMNYVRVFLFVIDVNV